MTVKDLIERLQKLPQDRPVCIVYDSGACWEAVHDVRAVVSDSWHMPGDVVALLDESAANDMDRAAE